jgi:hypothetical protein
MKSCAQCHGKLGLGVRSRNLWNGRWWVHVRFCSTHCEALYELERYEHLAHPPGPPQSARLIAFSGEKLVTYPRDCNPRLVSAQSNDEKGEAMTNIGC